MIKFKKLFRVFLFFSQSSQWIILTSKFILSIVSMGSGMCFVKLRITETSWKSISYISLLAKTYWSLMLNHFHLVIRVCKHKTIEKQLINSKTNNSGSLYPKVKNFGIDEPVINIYEKEKNSNYKDNIVKVVL